MSEAPNDSEDELVTFGGPNLNSEVDCCMVPRIVVRFRREPEYDTDAGKHYTRVDAHCVECGSTHDPEEVGY